MIPNQVDTVNVQSSGFAESFGMTIDEMSLVHIMDVLTKMYSDPALAVIREYSANALDSHVKAGNTDPIQITLPGRWNSDFIVRDFGVGMNVDYMRNVYSKYGASDKRDSDEYIGGFGIGSKAGLAYTNSFTVTAWQDGRRSRAIISIDEQGAGKFDIIDVVDSDEPAGVEVKIACKTPQEFSKKANDFFSFWTPGTVLVNGEEPSYKSGTAINDDLFYNKSNDYWNRLDSYVVVGSVPYKIDMDEIPNGNTLYGAGIGFVLRVGVGDVAIAPSREALTYTPGTKAVLAKAVDGLWEKIVQSEIDAINASPTYRTAYKRLKAIGRPFSDDKRFKDFVFKGAAFQSRIQHPHKELSFDYNDRGFIGDLLTCDLGSVLVSTELIVTGFQGKIVSTVLKRKMRQYAEDNGYSADTIMIVDKDTDNLWLSEIARVDLATIKAVKLAGGTNIVSNRVATYDVYTANGLTQETQVTGNKIYYASPVEMRRDERWSFQTSIDTRALAEKLDAAIVVLSKNRFDKFLREHPGAKPLNVAVKQEIERLAALSNDFDASEAGVSDWSLREFLKKAPVKDILDAELVAVISASRAQTRDANFDAAQALYNAARRGTLVGVKAPERKANRVLDILGRYPLIEYVGSNSMDHLIIYINTIFEKENI